MNNDINVKFTIGQMKRLALSSLRGRWGDLLLPTLIYVLAISIPSILDFFADIDFYRQLLTLSSSMGIGNMNMGYQPPGSTLITTFSLFYNILVIGAFLIGFSNMALNIIRREHVSIGTIFSGFKYFGQSISLYILYTLLCFAISLLAFIPAIVLSLGAIFKSPTLGIIGLILLIAAVIGIFVLVLRLAMSFFLAADNRTMGAGTALQRSAFIMAGNKLRYVLLVLSFIGWFLLATIPAIMGIILIVLNPSHMPTAISNLLGSLLISASILISCPIRLYWQTTAAIFYSDITGNFSTGNNQKTYTGTDLGIEDSSIDFPLNDNNSTDSTSNLIFKDTMNNNINHSNMNSDSLDHDNINGDSLDHDSSDSDSSDHDNINGDSLDHDSSNSDSSDHDNINNSVNQNNTNNDNINQSNTNINDIDKN